jgi:hypothetical protein
MRRILASTSLLFATATLYAVGFIAQATVTGDTAPPSSLSVDIDDSLATGPTLPPDDYDEPEGGTKVATGPTLPPDDYDEPEGGTKVATGPTLPPDDYDEPEGGTKAV